MIDYDVNAVLNEWNKQLKARQFIWGQLIKAQLDPNLALGREAEALVAGKLAAMGYQVTATSYHSTCDLIVNGALKVEIKAATWSQDGSRGRYQARLHKRQEADLVVLMTRSGWGDSFFVIPCEELDGQRSVTIRCYNPSSYSGRFSQYFEAWGLVGPALEETKNKPYQLNF